MAAAPTQKPDTVHATQQSKIVSDSMEEDEDEEWDFDYHAIPWIAAISIACAIIFGIVFISVTGVQVYDIIEAIHFPEKTLLDYINSMNT